MLGKCPNCGKKFEIQPDWIGKAAECPYCHEQIIIEIDAPQFNTQQVAGIGERFLALLFDGLILFVVNAVVRIIFTAIAMAIPNAASDSIGGIIITAMLNILSSILGCAIGMAYEAYFLSIEGATPGKKIFHLKVQYNGQNPSIVRSIGRHFAR
ncbi:MAG: RDD family protein, partial [Victivallales bacterium]|nr:RDD family protein [Victivallales bacterium]